MQNIPQGCYCVWWRRKGAPPHQAPKVAIVPPPPPRRAWWCPFAAYIDAHHTPAKKCVQTNDTNKNHGADVLQMADIDTQDLDERHCYSASYGDSTKELHFCAANSKVATWEASRQSTITTILRSRMHHPCYNSDVCIQYITVKVTREPTTADLPVIQNDPRLNAAADTQTKLGEALECARTDRLVLQQSIPYPHHHHVCLSIIKIP